MTPKDFITSRRFVGDVSSTQLKKYNPLLISKSFGTNYKMVFSNVRKYCKIQKCILSTGNGLSLLRFLPLVPSYLNIFSYQKHYQMKHNISL